MGAAPVRTFHARRGRLSPLTRARLRDLAARYAVPEGLLDGPATDRADVVVDIGCGHGAATLAFAAAYPQASIVGIDVYPPGIARLLDAAQAQGLPNLHVRLGDAVDLLREGIAPGRLAAVHLFFPDPWPKARHRKRRFVSVHTLRLLHAALRPGGHVLVATDQADYAGQVRREVLADGGFVLREIDRPPWRPVSGFEDRAVRAGRAVIDLRLDHVPDGHTAD